MKKRIVCLLCCMVVLWLFPPAAAAKEVTSALSAVLIEANSGRILYEKNADEKRPLASCTKILTALTVIDSCAPQEVVTVPKAAVGIEGSSIYLKEGEHLTVEELLYGLMLQSGNDAAVALALHTAGSVDAFADKMNQKAKECGASDSHFTNPHGLQDERHYTTARDLARISCAAMKNERFRTVVGTKSITVSNETTTRYLTNKNKLLTQYDGANGIKTGYTQKAGRCYVGAAERKGMQLIAVVLHCAPMFEDSRRMFDEAFQKYRMVNLLPKNKYLRMDGKKVTTKEGFSYPLTADEEKQISVRYRKTAAEKKNLGIVEIYCGNQLIFSTKLYTMESKKANRKDLLFLREFYAFK